MCFLACSYFIPFIVCVKLYVRSLACVSVLHGMNLAWYEHACFLRVMLAFPVSACIFCLLFFYVFCVLLSATKKKIRFFSFFFFFICCFFCLHDIYIYHFFKCPLPRAIDYSYDIVLPVALQHAHLTVLVGRRRPDKTHRPRGRPT